MKKIIFLFCFITLFACSKSEDVSLVPDNSIEVSHITNDDLALVDGSILLTISKEEAVKRGKDLVAFLRGITLKPRKNGLQSKRKGK